MSKLFVFASIALFTSVGFAKKDGFYVKGRSAATEAGALAFYNEMVEAQESGDADICYSGDYESALENVHDSLSISIIDMYESGQMDAEVTYDGETIGAIISPCD